MKKDLDLQGFLLQLEHVHQGDINRRLLMTTSSLSGTSIYALWKKILFLSHNGNDSPSFVACFQYYTDFLTWALQSERDENVSCQQAIDCLDTIFTTFWMPMRNMTSKDWWSKATTSH